MLLAMENQRLVQKNNLLEQNNSRLNVTI
jgi:chromosome segregation ATPase